LTIVPADRRRGRGRGPRFAILSLAWILLALVGPVAILADGIQVKLSLRAIGQPGSFFDLTMQPGETRSLAVEIANPGTVATAARTYGSDVYTIVNGGFGARLRDEPQTGATRWLDYPTAVLALSVGESVRRTFEVAVPADARPGEYITSLVLENDVPIRDGGSIGFDQIVRQAVGVVVNVPGTRSPSLAIGEASHSVVAGRSVISVAVENPGNIRLGPVASFTLRDAGGALLSEAVVPMDTFYAGTGSSVEVPLDGLLRPGTYTVRLSLVDDRHDVHVERTMILVVEPPPGLAANDTSGARRIALGDGGDRGMPIAIEIGAAGGVGLVVLLGLVSVVRRRRRISSPNR